MASSFEVTGGRIVGLKNGVSFFDTEAYPVQFYPTSDKIVLTGLTISFPDFHHANAYGYAAGDTGGGVIQQSCHSFVTLPFQEWGPSDAPGITDTLSDVVIGTVPDGTDLRRIRVKLTRTSAPDQINGNDVPVEPQEGEWVNADGGSMVLEFLWPLARMIWIRKAAASNGDGTTNLLLTRKQSIQKRLYTHWRLNNSPTSTGWTYGGTNGMYGHIVKSIQQKGPTIAPGGVITYRRGEGSQCSLTDTSDFSSTYMADIEIIPGRSNIVPEGFGAGAGGGTTFVFTDLDSQNPTSSTHTYTSKFLGVAPGSGETRHIIVAVTGYSGDDTSAQNVNSVTIDGVAASLAVRQRTYIDLSGSNDFSVVSAIFIAEVPNHDEGDIQITWSTAFWFSQIEVYAAYNLASTTPDDTVTSNAGGTFGLSTVPGGFAISLYCSSSNASGGNQTLSGIDNLVHESPVFSDPSVRQPRRIRGFQETDGSTLSLVVDATFARLAFCAASFH